MTKIHYIIGTPNKDLSKLVENERYFEITDYSGGGTTIDANTINALLGGGNVSNSVVNGLVKLDFDASAFLTIASANTTYLTKTDASNIYQLKGNYVTTASLTTTLAGYTTNASLDTKLDTYAKKTEIPDVSVLTKTTDFTAEQKKQAYDSFIKNPLFYPKTFDALFQVNTAPINQVFADGGTTASLTVLQNDFVIATVNSTVNEDKRVLTFKFLKPTVLTLGRATHRVVNAAISDQIDLFLYVYRTIGGKKVEVSFEQRDLVNGGNARQDDCAFSNSAYPLFLKNEELEIKVLQEASPRKRFIAFFELTTFYTQKTLVGNFEDIFFAKMQEDFEDNRQKIITSWA